MSFEDQELEEISENKRKYGTLLPLLRGKGSLWHCTGMKELEKILSAKTIFPSRHPNVISRWQSGRSYNDDLVSVFDFDFNDEGKIYSKAVDWMSFLYGVRALHYDNVLIEIDRTRLQSNYLPPIDSESNPTQFWTINKLKMIPYVEAWVEKSVSTSAFKSLGIVLGEGETWDLYKVEDVSPAGLRLLQDKFKTLKHDAESRTPSKSDFDIAAIWKRFRKDDF